MEGFVILGHGVAECWKEHVRRQLEQAPGGRGAAGALIRREVAAAIGQFKNPFIE